jgi:serine/threonine protein phosphatase 1
MSVQITTREWCRQPINAEEKVIFAIGDVHGLDVHLAALHEEIRAIIAANRKKACLVLLGDLVDGGPASAAVLQRVASDDWKRGFERAECLIGNHEILMWLFLNSGDAQLRDRWNLWSKSKARTMFESLGIRNINPKDSDLSDTDLKMLRNHLSVALGYDAEGGSPLRQLMDCMRSHVRIGNLLFVHGGIDPDADEEALSSFLKRPWEEGPYTSRNPHWAWIRREFLLHEGKSRSGVLVVHGHTPEFKIESLLDILALPYHGAHVFTDLRLGLDAGTYQNRLGSFKIAAAQLEDGRYRIILAEG